MIVVRTRRELAEALEGARGGGTRISLVPTMGFLHEGHLSLMDLARTDSDLVAASIFVNPLQFGQGEDLDRYPRDTDRDLGLLEERGVGLVFQPSAEEMYPVGEPRVTVDPGPMGGLLCGAYRPGHFRGVLTVVARLFSLFRPSVAAFGQKDFQQVALVERMVRDLELGVRVLRGPVVREEDGLAMSSRNVFLTQQEREDALGLFRGLMAVQDAFAEGETSSAALRGCFIERAADHPGLVIQYAEVVDPDSLLPLDPAPPGAVVAAAGFCGSTRLIDNHTLVN
jgi:pantoate--beta-alanine ligase